MKIDGLLDSNVVIAMLVEAHEHHFPSLDLMISATALRFAVAAHSYAEAYSALTRKGERALFQLTPQEAWRALESVQAITSLVGLSPPQTLETVRDYARSGGVGARLYDRLIGDAAVTNGIGMIVTWNLGHMRSLFPGLTVATPLDVTNGTARA